MNLDNNQPMEDFSDDAPMARADLYKTGKYSLKLIKMIHDGQELPAWVQAKITKAADYIASVYHFMEFDIKKSEFGDHLDNADIYAEHLQTKYQQKLMEAKANLKHAKKKAVKKEVKNACTEDCSQCNESCDTRLDEGPYLGTKYVDVHHPKFGKLELLNLGSFMMIIGEPNSGFKDIKGDPKSVRDKWKALIHDAKMEKARAGGFETMGLGPLKRATESLAEKAKPSAGMTKKEKSTVVKKAKAGEDIGKKGKGFSKVEKAAKKSGASNPTAIAASAMWKQQAKKG